MLVMLMIRPARRFIMPLMTARMVWKAPLRLASSTASQSSSLSRSRMLSRVRPALLTRMSIGPRACSAAAIAASTCAASSHIAGHPGGPLAQRRRDPCRLRPIAADDGHLGARAVERLRDGESDAPGAAGDERGLPVRSIGSDSRLSSEELLDLIGRSQRDRLAPGTIRLSRPDSTAPGPISMKRAPGTAALAACMQSTQRTGAVS